MKNRQGFTLMEVMVAVAILAVGLAPVLQAFSVSLGAFGLYADALNVSPWIDEKIWETRNDLMVKRFLPAGETSGRVVIGPREYDWIMRVDPVIADKGLYRLDVVLSWNKKGATRNISRTAYALAPVPEKIKQAPAVP